MKPTRYLHGYWLLGLLLLVVISQQANCDGVPSGTIVWWGRDLISHPPHLEYTNGIIEKAGEMLEDVIAITGRRSQCLALTRDGTVMAFGLSLYGGDAIPAGLSNVVSIAIEGSSCWAIKQDGTVARWGEDPDDANIVAGLSNITAIAWAGYRSYLALKSDGTVLGFRFDDPPNEPVRLVRVDGQILSNVVAIVQMGDTPLVLKKNSSVLCLGCERPGASPLGPGFTGAEKPYEYAAAGPIMIDGRALSNVTAIASGGAHALALRKDGHVLAWGRNDYGEAIVPAGLSNVTAIAADEHSSLALKSDETVVAWGANEFGQASVPTGLSNVIAIAAGGWLNFALTTGAVPSSVYLPPHGRLEQMEREADLVFKGTVLFSKAATNTSFPSWGKPHATQFSIVSALKGRVTANELTFWHNTSGPGAWGGGTPPSWHQFEPGQSYLVFATRLDKPDYLYSPPPNAANRTDEFRQLRNGGVMLTLDARKITASNVKDAHWFELNLLLGDSDPTNQLYAIDQLDKMSLAGRRDDQWSRSKDFGRRAVLSALLPMVTNHNLHVTQRALSCFGTETNAEAQLTPFIAALSQVANQSPSPHCRLAAIAALSGLANETVSNSLIQLSQDPEEDIRVASVGLMPRFPVAFAEQALKERATDESAKVRSVVADVIGENRLVRLLPTLAKLFDDPVGRNPLIAPLTMEDLRAGQRWSNIGDVHTSAGMALVKFAPGEVADVLRTNLNDPGFHINFVSKLAEGDAEPWLPELVTILETRYKQVQQVAKLHPGDPRRFACPINDRVLIGTYSKCWEDLRQYLLNLPRASFMREEIVRYVDLLDKTVEPIPGCPSCCVMAARSLYELYHLKELASRAHELRRRFGNTDGWWFDEFDRNHPASAVR